MATMIPALSTLSRMTPGERRLGHRLEALLVEDNLVWFDIPMGPRRRYPDFIILQPSRGLMFLEVKDWKVDTLRAITPERVELETRDGRKTDSNPLAQARQCGFAAVNQLQRDPQLTQIDDGYRGKLCFPYGYGVVLPNITRKQWNKMMTAEEQERVLPGRLLICQDEMTSSVSPGDFQQRLRDMFQHDFGKPLTPTQVDRIRWQLFPEVRIDASSQDLFDDNDMAEQGAEGKPMPDIVKVMDLQQERLARNMGEGHRVIHGVAGSGKTLILGYRCQHLARSLNKPVLVLCFNITLAARLRAFITDKGIADKIRVHHFHEWCGQQLKMHKIDVLDGEAKYFERQVDSVIAAVEDERIPTEQYGAVMIDEGHDFEQSWLKLATQMVDSTSNSLLLLYDDAQSIYQKRSLSFPLSSAGIQARGRTTILKQNYRNSREILTFAYDFAQDFIKAKEADEDHIPLIAPEIAGESGPQPAFSLRKNGADEADFLVHCVRKWQSEGYNLNSIAVVYTTKTVGKRIHDALQAADIPSSLPLNSAEKRDYDAHAQKVVLLSRQSSKGLEFDTVLLCGLGELQQAEDKRAQEARLIYVGMTRARKRLMLTGSRDNWCTQRLSEISASRKPSGSIQ